jgi:hypothetical protein
VIYYTKPQTIHAIQWYTHGDHPNVIPLPGDWQEETCPYCHGLWKHHGMSIKASGRSISIVCPGGYIVTKDGITTVMSETAFNAAYQDSEGVLEELAMIEIPAPATFPIIPRCDTDEV